MSPHLPGGACHSLHAVRPFSFPAKFSPSLWFEGECSPLSLRDADRVARTEPVTLSAGSAFGPQIATAMVLCWEDQLVAASGTQPLLPIFLVVSGGDLWLAGLVLQSHPST